MPRANCILSNIFFKYPTYEWIAYIEKEPLEAGPLKRGEGFAAAAVLRHWLGCALFKISGLPDEKGRFQILHIHTVRMREHQLLAEDVDIAELAVETKNFSGAELEGLVRAAQSTAMNRHIKVSPIISCWGEGKRENMWSLFWYVYFQMDNVISAPSILEEDCLAFFHRLLIMGGQCIFK